MWSISINGNRNNIFDKKFVFLYLIFTGNLLGRYCGNTLPDAVDTSDSFAYVKFVSDGSINARGFRLRFDSSTEGWICKAASYFQGRNILPST